MFKNFISVVLSAAVGCAVISAAPVSAQDYVGAPKSELLGTASNFSVFVEDTFAANGSDCEGRLAAGGGANYGTAGSYAVGKSVGYPSIIVASGDIKNFDGGGNTAIVAGDNVKVEGNFATIIRETPIDFAAEFTKLRELSKELNKETGSTKIENLWCTYVTFTGTDPNYNYFKLDAEKIKDDKTFFDFNVPADSYAVVTFEDTNPTFYTQLYGTQFSGTRIGSNGDLLNEHILYNFPNAETIELAGTGTQHGTILAPKAKGFDKMESGAHVSGNLITKSYEGGIEFGYVGFSGPRDNRSTGTSTATTTATTTTTTTSTTTTSTTTRTTTTTAKPTTTTSTTIIATTTTTTKPTTTTTTTTTATSTTTSKITTTSTTSTTTTTTTSTTTTRSTTTSTTSTSTTTTTAIKPTTTTTKILSTTFTTSTTSATTRLSTTSSTTTLTTQSTTDTTTSTNTSTTTAIAGTTGTSISSTGVNGGVATATSTTVTSAATSTSSNTTTTAANNETAPKTGVAFPFDALVTGIVACGILALFKKKN